MGCLGQISFQGIYADPNLILHRVTYSELPSNSHSPVKKSKIEKIIPLIITRTDVTPYSFTIPRPTMSSPTSESIVSGTSRTASIISSVFTSKAPTITDESQLYSLDGDPKALNEKPVRSDVRVSAEEQSIKEVPYHVYGRRETLILVSIVSVAASLSGLSSNVYFPAMVDVADVRVYNEYIHMRRRP